jgi:Carboxypeptidase regulatory-like domain/TonB dependent receptor
MKLFKYLLFVCALLASTAVYAQQTGSLSGQVYDSLGGVLKGATVAITGSDGKVKNTVSNGQGEFQVNGLAPGKYTVVVKAEKFGDYENQEVEIIAGKKEELTIAMTVQITETAVEVSNAGQVSTEVDENKSSTVLKGTDLDALPDDPDELEAALQALAGPSAGPNGGQFFIDGFAGGRIPSKESIREIRINSNPFSAEFDRLGFGRVEILTKPGSDKFRGQAAFNFNDESLNSRNPFAANRAPSQTRNYNGSISGPIQKGKSSFFVDISERELDNNAIINAKILDSSFNVVNFSKDVVVPTRRFSFSPRFDYQINPSNTLVARYSYGRNSSENQGVGGTSLASRASTNKGNEHEFRLTETAILNAKTVNETRFEYRTTNRDQVGDKTVPTVNVFDAFTGGGSQVGLNYTRQKNWEINNFTTTSFGKKASNSVKFGVRIRGVKNENRSESNFGGTFNFAGTPGFYTPTGCNPAPPLPLPVGCVFTPGSDSISQYRQKLLGNTNPIYNPSQFTITTGNPVADVSQTEYGVFLTDDWKARPDLTLSIGLRYENQTNISSNKNFAPRFGFAWSPGAGGARQPKMTFRGGAGIFYERFGEGNTLQANRFDGVRQQQYLLTNTANAAILSGIVFNANGTISNVPTAAQLSTLAPRTNTIRIVDSNARAAYTMQTLFSAERSLPKGITIAATYVWARTLNSARQVNINAPRCPPLQVLPQPCTASNLDPTKGVIYQYQTNGVVNSQFLNINFRSGFGSKFTFFGNYRFGFTKDNADTPMYTYDLSSEYGTSSRDVRHNFVLGGSYTAPWKIRLNPFIILSSATPFNITTGLDNNRDSNFNDRPAFATDLTRTSVKRTPFGDFDINPIAGQVIIPKNYGRSTASYNVNLNMSRSFGFGGKKAPAPATTATTGTATAGTTGGGRDGGGRGGAGGGMMGMPGMGGGRGGFGGGETNQPYNFTVGVNVSNLLNTANLGSRTGNLSSPFFGQATNTGGAFGFFGGGGGGGGFGGNGSANRRVEVQLRFSF